jgi:hypothetical protein
VNLLKEAAMLETRTRLVALYVDRSTQQWVVRDDDGKLWVIRGNPDCWKTRLPFESTEKTELELVPGHYRYMLGLP